MSRLTADFAPELLELYDYYAHGKITKRQFLELAAKIRRRWPDSNNHFEANSH